MEPSLSVPVVCTDVMNLIIKLTRRPTAVNSEAVLEPQHYQRCGGGRRGMVMHFRVAFPGLAIFRSSSLWAAGDTLWWFREDRVRFCQYGLRFLHPYPFLRVGLFTLHRGMNEFGFCIGHYGRVHIFNCLSAFGAQHEGGVALLGLYSIAGTI